MDRRIDFVSAHRCGLGESPLWDPDLRALFWVDAVAHRIVRHDLDTGAERVFTAPGVVGSIVLGAPGRLIVGIGHAVHRLDLADGRFEEVAGLPGLPPSVRLNDGKTDRQGRFVTGSMTSPYQGENVGRLYRFDRGGVVEVLQADVGVSNAICFSPAGERMYFADSVRQLIWAYGYDGESGAVGAPTTLIDTASLGSFPDGATVDAEGDLWIALLQIGEIARFGPDGRLKDRVASPSPLPSCPAFGGEDMDVLYVTTFSDAGGAFATDHPDGGRTLAITGLGVRGVPETRCRL